MNLFPWGPWSGACYLGSWPPVTWPWPWAQGKTHKVRFFRDWVYMFQVYIRTTTPFSKRNATLICLFSLLTLGHWPWHRVFMNLLNGVFGKLLPWAMSKWCISPDSLIYTLLQKKGNFNKVAFLLEKSVAHAMMGVTITERVNITNVN